MKNPVLHPDNQGTKKRMGKKTTAPGNENKKNRRGKETKSKKIQNHANTHVPWDRKTPLK